MKDTPAASSQMVSSIPPDDRLRRLTIAKPNIDVGLPHIAVAGGTYTILVTGNDTAGRYCLIDMHIPPGGGPPPHRHNFEEMFGVLDGEIEFTFRGSKSILKTGETANILTDAPHSFKNVSSAPARLLCMCAPGGQEEFFAKVGDAVETRTSPPPKLEEAARAARMAKVKALAPQYKSELL